MLIINDLTTLFQNKDFATLQSRVDEHSTEAEQEILALSAQGANINPQDPETGLTVLHFICAGWLDNILLNYFGANHIINTNEHPLLNWAAQSANIIALQWLLERGQNIDIQDNTGMTPLHIATTLGHFEELTFLLTNGANVTLQNEYGHTALWQTFFYTNEPITDDVKIGILELLIQRGSDVNVIDSYGNIPIKSLLDYSPFQEGGTKHKALLLLLSANNINIPLNIQQIFDYFTSEDNIIRLFAVEDYEEHKVIAAGYNLYKALKEYGETNNNPQVLDIATHINQTVLNNAADVLQLAINSTKPHVSITDIEQTNNIYLLRDNIMKCEEFKKLIIRLQELDVVLEGILELSSPFYEFSNCLNHLEETEIATVKRISEIFTKNLILPALPEREELVKQLKVTTEPEKAAIIISKLQAPGMQAVFNDGGLMHSVCSFLDPQSASDFSYTNKNTAETLITLPDQETSGNIEESHNQASG